MSSVLDMVFYVLNKYYFALINRCKPQSKVIQQMWPSHLPLFFFFSSCSDPTECRRPGISASYIRTFLVGAFTMGTVSERNLRAEHEEGLWAKH